MKSYKICISATGNDLDAALDPRFGRALYFLIVDEKGKLIKAIKNSGVQAMRGAGIAAAQFVVKEKVDIVITGNIGPNALAALTTSGVEVYLAPPGMRLRDVIDQYRKGALQQVKEPLPYRPGFGFGPGPRRRGFGGRGRGRGRGRLGR